MATTPAQIENRSEGRTSRGTAGQPTAGDFAPPPKLRRRPGLIVASVAAICLGSMASLWAYNSTSSAEYVLGVRQTVERGQVIEASDLMKVRISVDPALKPLSVDEADAVIGRHAALDMPAGSIITREQVTERAVPANGNSVVGISVAASMLPASELRIGDRVRLVTTPPQQQAAAASVPQTTDAVVVSMSEDPAQSGETLVNVEVTAGKAPEVAVLAAGDRIAIVLDSREG